MADKKSKGADASKTKAAAPPKTPKTGDDQKKKAKAQRTESSAGAVTMERPSAPTEKPRLAKFYEETVRPALMEKFAYKSVMQAPRLEKIVLNMGVGDAVSDQKMLDAAMNELGQITGQRPALRRARKSISNFKLREGVGVG